MGRRGGLRAGLGGFPDSGRNPLTSHEKISNLHVFTFDASILELLPACELNYTGRDGKTDT